MVKIILSVIFIATSIVTFAYFTKAQYKEIKILDAKIKQIDEARAKALSIQNQITEKLEIRNSIDDNTLIRLSKMVPKSVDNIQLILDIEGITKKYNMRMQKVNISKSSSQEKKKGQATINVGVQKDNTGINSLDMSFEVVSSYDNFIQFLRDLEYSLRIVDIVNLSFSSGSESGQQNQFATINKENVNFSDADIDQNDVYTFKVVLRTYWITVE